MGFFDDFTDFFEDDVGGAFSDLGNEISSIATDSADFIEDTAVDSWDGIKEGGEYLYDEAVKPSWNGVIKPQIGKLYGLFEKGEHATGLAIDAYGKAATGLGDSLSSPYMWYIIAIGGGILAYQVIKNK